MLEDAVPLLPASMLPSSEDNSLGAAEVFHRDVLAGHLTDDVGAGDAAVGGDRQQQPGVVVEPGDDLDVGAGLSGHPADGLERRVAQMAPLAADDAHPRGRRPARHQKKTERRVMRTE